MNGHRLPTIAHWRVLYLPYPHLSHRRAAVLGRLAA
jgi:hypothetical protein